MNSTETQQQSQPEQAQDQEVFILITPVIEDQLRGNHGSTATVAASLRIVVYRYAEDVEAANKDGEGYVLKIPMSQLRGLMCEDDLVMFTCDEEADYPGLSVSLLGLDHTLEYATSEQRAKNTYEEPWPVFTPDAAAWIEAVSAAIQKSIEY